jgi:hypothetical protein
VSLLSDSLDIQEMERAAASGGDALSMASPVVIGRSWLRIVCKISAVAFGEIDTSSSITMWSIACEIPASERQRLDLITAARSHRVWVVDGSCTALRDPCVMIAVHVWCTMPFVGNCASTASGAPQKPSFVYREQRSYASGGFGTVNMTSLRPTCMVPIILANRSFSCLRVLHHSFLICCPFCAVRVSKQCLSTYKSKRSQSHTPRIVPITYRDERMIVSSSSKHTRHPILPIQNMTGSFPAVYKDIIIQLSATTYS